MTHVLSADERFFAHLKEAAGELPTNEDDSTPGTNEVQSDTKGTGTGLDASWGAKTQDVSEHGQAAVDADQKEREQVVNNLFDGKTEFDKREQSFMAENFSHVGSGDFTTHSLHLRSKTKTAMPRTPTLADQVRQRLGYV